MARLPHPILVPAFAGRPAEKCPTNNFFVEIQLDPPTTSHFRVNTLPSLTPVAHHEDDMEGCAYLDSPKRRPTEESHTDSFHR